MGGGDEEGVECSALVYVISRVHHAFGSIFILSTLLFLSCALQAHVRSKHPTNTLTLHKT